MAKKVHIIGCDGTWQTEDQKNPTNVALLLHAVADNDAAGAPQLRKHFNGVASDKKRLQRIWDGATGNGLSRKVKEAYLYIAQNYTPGDDIVLVGFSRGSYTVRSLAGLIYKCGIPDRNGKDGNDLEGAVDRAYDFYRCNRKPASPEAKNFRAQHAINDNPQMKLACFDTVGALGIPKTPLNIISTIINSADQFHDTRVNPNITLALHAVSIDETRKSFIPTPMDKSDDAAQTVIYTRYFVGDHGGVGGGSEANKNKPISDIAALWVAETLETNSNVRFDHKKLQAIFNPDALANKGSDFDAGGIWRWMLKTVRDVPDVQSLHPTVKQRVKAQDDYRPKALKKFINKLIE